MGRLCAGMKKLRDAMTTTVSSMVISPPSGRSSPAMQRSVVDFPQPDGPKQREEVPRLNVEGYSLHCLDLPLVGGEQLEEVGNIESNGRHDTPPLR